MGKGAGRSLQTHSQLACACVASWMAYEAFFLSAHITEAESVQHAYALLPEGCKEAEGAIPMVSSRHDD